MAIDTSAETKPAGNQEQSAAFVWEDTYAILPEGKIHYLRAGSGRPMLLIHGLVGSSVNWRRNIDALACGQRGPGDSGACVYALDLPNRGRADRVRGLDAGRAATADRVAAFMNALGINEGDIVGHSHGGAVALMLAARHPDRVRSLALFAPANPYSNLSDRLVRIYSSALGIPLAGIAPYLPAWSQRIALGRMYGDPARIVAGTLEGYIEGLRVPGTIGHVLAIVRGWFADMAQLRAALPRVRVPVLLVWGDRDRAVSLASGKRLQRELSGSRLTVIPGAGHVLFEEMPGEANRQMIAWVCQERGSVIPKCAEEPASKRPNRGQPQSSAASTTVAPAL